MITRRLQGDPVGDHVICHRGFVQETRSSHEDPALAAVCLGAVTVQVTIRDQNGASRRFQAVGASTGRTLHDTMSSASIRIRGKISPNLVTPRLREIERDCVGWRTGMLDIGACTPRTHPVDAHTAWI